MTSVPKGLSGFARLLLLVAALQGTALPSQAQTRAVSPAASIKLVNGGPDGQVYSGGIAIDLPPGTKTYWRSPGESGIPPRFDWTGSSNLKSVSVLWPVPQRFEDGGASSVGYEAEVVLPIRVEPADPTRPVLAKLSIDYAVCTTICIPLHDMVTTKFEPGRAGDATARARIDMFRERVPKQGQPGESGGLALLRVKAAGDSAVEVEARVPASAAGSDVFIEGPDGWLFGSAVPVMRSEGASRHLSWRIPVEDRPEKDALLREITISVTLASEDRGIEGVYPLDALTPAR